MRPTWTSIFAAGALATTGLWGVGDTTASAQSVPVGATYPYPPNPALSPGPGGASAAYNYSSSPALTAPSRGTSPTYAGAPINMVAPSRGTSPTYAGAPIPMVAPSRGTSPTYAGYPGSGAVAPNARTPVTSNSNSYATPAASNMYGGTPINGVARTALTSYTPPSNGGNSVGRPEDMRPAAGPAGSAFAPDTRPWPATTPPKKPSALRRFWNRLTDADKDTPVDPNKHTYIDPSTGRTDLPFSKPWLKPVW